MARLKIVRDSGDRENHDSHTLVIIPLENISSINLIGRETSAKIFLNL
jgi:hypothetical protein